MIRRAKPAAVLLGLVLTLCVTLFGSAQSAAAYPPHVAPIITINPTHPTCGSTLHIQGHHFKPGEVVTITINGHREARFRADKHGNFSGSFTLVCYGTGPQTLRAIGSDGDKVTLVIDVAGITEHRHDHHSQGSGGLSSTGVAVAAIGALAVVLLVSGGLLVFFGRRRRAGA